MQQYKVFNVDIFDRNFVNYYHDNVNSIEYKFDYLSPVENEIQVLTNERVKYGDYIRIWNSDYSYFGVITAIDYGLSANELMAVSYAPFTSIFNTTVLFDTNLQGGSVSLETVLKNIIQANFKTNTDTYANIDAIGTIYTTSSTNRWGFNIKSDKEGQHYAIINLYDVLLTRSFNKYGIVVNVIPDFSTRKINIEIGKIETNRKTIEADLPNVLDRSIIIRGTTNDINKLTIYNSAGFTQMIRYYLHRDGSFDTNNQDRLTPVVNQYVAVDVPEDKTFAQVAESQANESFGNITYENLIELLALNDDSMINPNALEIGQMVNVVHDGISYSSILSGKEIGLTTKLIFGSIRLDLTKIIKTGGL